MKPLLDLLVTQPGLLADHALAYAELAAQESAGFARICKRRLLLAACALCCASLACGLAGVAFMLWFVSPAAHEVFPWPLVAIPSLPAAVSVWCLTQLNAAKAQQSFEKLRQQLNADKVLLQEMGLP
jgi:hypothetical protein